MSVKLLAEHNLEFLSLKGGGTGSSESTLVKMPHCWKSHVTAHMSYSILVIFSVSDKKGDPCSGQPLYSYVAHETDCKKYYICMGPTKSTKRCTRGYFSPRVPGYCVLAYSQSECARKQK